MPEYVVDNPGLGIDIIIDMGDIGTDMVDDIGVVGSGGGGDARRLDHAELRFFERCVGLLLSLSFSLSRQLPLSLTFLVLPPLSLFLGDASDSPKVVEDAVDLTPRPRPREDKIRFRIDGLFGGSAALEPPPAAPPFADVAMLHLDASNAPAPPLGYTLSLFPSFASRG